jgi:hypothetical protein
MLTRLQGDGGETTETDEERALFIANEIGAAVVDLIANGMDVNRINITDYLELK